MRSEKLTIRVQGLNLKSITRVRSGFKTPSKAQWLRCRPPVNAHIPMYAENNDFLVRPAPYP